MAWTQHCREEEEAEALTAAALAGDLDETTKLLEKGAAWDCEDRSGVTAGEYALHQGHEAVIEALVAHGAASVVASRGPHASRKDWNEAYLKQRVRYDEGNLVDGTGMPVMMPWEGQIMRAHTEVTKSKVMGAPLHTAGAAPDTVGTTHSVDTALASQHLALCICTLHH